MASDQPGRPEEIYRTIEQPLLPVLLRMEEAGVGLDVGFLGEMSEELQLHLDQLESEIYAIAGEEFNINSPSQLGEIMFEKLDYPVLKRTRKTKSYSTNAETLEELAASERDCWEGRHSERPYVLVAQQSSIDTSRAPDGQQTGWAYIHVPAGSTRDCTAIVENGGGI